MAGDTETLSLWLEYRQTREKALRDQLILRYSPLVKYVAGRLGSGLPAHIDDGDLVSYGLLGLISAIDRFDPDRDIKFETYAIARIRGAIIDELRTLDWVPRSVRARARQIERAIGELEARLGRAPTDEEIADTRRHHRRRARRLAAATSRARRSRRSTSSGRSRARATRSRCSTRSRIPAASSRPTRSTRPRCARRSPTRSRACPSARRS